MMVATVLHYDAMYTFLICCIMGQIYKGKSSNIVTMFAYLMGVIFAVTCRD